MNKHILKIIRIAFGSMLILVGTLGIFLPVLPGWILIFVGLELVGIQIIFLDRIKAYIMEKIKKLK